jgi:hypothetical protein
MKSNTVPGAVGDEVGSTSDAGYGGEGDNVASVQAEHQAQSTSDDMIRRISELGLIFF